MDAHSFANAGPMPLQAPIGMPAGPVGLPAHQPLAPGIAEQLAGTPHLVQPGNAPLRDPFLWTMLKNLVLAAFVAMCVLVALDGDGNLMMTANYAGAAFLMIVTFVMADRLRFLTAWCDDDAPIVIVTTEPAHAARDIGGYAPVPMMQMTWTSRPPLQPAPPSPAQYRSSVT